MKRYQVINGTGGTFGRYDTLQAAKAQCGQDCMIYDLRCRMIVYRERDGHDMFPAIQREF